MHCFVDVVYCLSYVVYYFPEVVYCLSNVVYCYCVLFIVFSLTLSLWLQPDVNSNGGFLVAKVKDGELLYGLELRTLFQIVFVYRPSDSSVSGSVCAWILY